MYFLNLTRSKGRKLFIIILCIVLLAVTFVLTKDFINPWKGINRNNYGDNFELYSPTCSAVLDTMVDGRWVKNRLQENEINDVENFNRKVRSFLGMPWSLQRSDFRCGNIPFKTSKKDPGTSTKRFRSLCNPSGTTPCCYEHKCMLKPIEECKCQHCYDLRQQIQAELSTWIPSDPACKVVKFLGVRDSCAVLKNMVIYFIGDSSMRQLYIAVLSLLRSHKRQGPLKEKIPHEMLERCDKNYRLTTECTNWIINDASECNTTVRVRNIRYWKADQTGKALESIEELLGHSNTYVLLTAGVNENFNLNAIKREILNPLLEQFSKDNWPKPIWLAAQSPGLLKAPSLVEHQPENVLKYNSKVKDIMKKKGVPVLDFFQLTNGVLSYDGTNFGAGVNDMKAQIFLNYMLELRSNPTSIHDKHDEDVDDLTE